jgi:hypothetical protein
MAEKREKKESWIVRNAKRNIKYKFQNWICSIVIGIVVLFVLLLLLYKQ